MTGRRQTHFHNVSVASFQLARQSGHEGESETLEGIVLDRYSYIDLQRLEPSLNQPLLKPLQYASTQ